MSTLGTPMNQPEAILTWNWDPRPVHRWMECNRSCAVPCDAVVWCRTCFDCPDGVNFGVIRNYRGIYQEDPTTMNCLCLWTVHPKMMDPYGSLTKQIRWLVLIVSNPTCGASITQLRLPRHQLVSISVALDVDSFDPYTFWIYWWTYIFQYISLSFVVTLFCVFDLPTCICTYMIIHEHTYINTHCRWNWSTIQNRCLPEVLTQCDWYVKKGISQLPCSMGVFCTNSHQHVYFVDVQIVRYCKMQTPIFPGKHVSLGI